MAVLRHVYNGMMDCYGRQQQQEGDISATRLDLVFTQFQVGSLWADVT